MPSGPQLSEPRPSPLPGDDGGDAEPFRRWRLDVEIIHENGDWASLGEPESAIARAVAALTGRSEFTGRVAAVATVALSTDAHVRELNAGFRGKDAPTNVLSFPAGGALPSAPDAPVMIGDVIVALETVVREARAAGIPTLHHLQHLAIHGLLHLVGYDHETDADAERMEALETAVLRELGVADPYAPLEETEEA